MMHKLKMRILTLQILDSTRGSDVRLVEIIGDAEQVSPFFLKILLLKSLLSLVWDRWQMLRG